jgi:ubiquinone/menaquinone biosynthesis C-methylase UbiE
MIYKYPKNFSRFYDTIYHQMRDSTDHGFFQKEIAKTGGKVLEVGVGTGRLFSDALESGADIYGLDISEEMLKILYKKIPEDKHFRISQQSITDFRYDHNFDLIIAPFRVIMHLIDKEDQMKALDNVYRHLNAGGRFIFDAFIPNLNQLINGINNQTDFDDEYEPGLRMRRIVTTTPDLIHQTINISFRMEWDEKDCTKKENWFLPLRYFFRYELEHLIERSKFESYSIFGDYKGNELNNESKDFIVICRKTTG